MAARQNGLFLPLSIDGENFEMNIGIVNEETWAFFGEVSEELASHHQTSLFLRRKSKLPILKERVNFHLLRKDLKALIHNNHVIFFEWASELLSAASHLPKTCGIITRLHRYEMYHWADKINWENVDRIILVSDAKQREFKELFPKHASKTIVIPEAVSVNKFVPIKRRFEGNLGILCHLSPRKRVYELILAFYQMCQLRNDLHLHIGGEGHPRFPDYKPSLVSLVQDLGLQEKVTFHGKVSDAYRWYANIDIFISNSYNEGLQVSPMEAISTGCYCLAHRWQGADELLPEECLYYTDQELIQKVLAHCDTHEIEREQKIACLQSIVRERFDVDKTKVLIRKVVEEVGATYINKNGHHS
jgi:glycosyltransferase involved in cell wall biosynthesis